MSETLVQYLVVEASAFGFVRKIVDLKATRSIYMGHGRRTVEDHSRSRDQRAPWKLLEIRLLMCVFHPLQNHSRLWSGCDPLPTLVQAEIVGPWLVYSHPLQSLLRCHRQLP